MNNKSSVPRQRQRSTRTPERLSPLSINALVAADAFIIPSVREYLALEGLVGLLEVDRDGDGTVDFEWYPGAAGLEEESTRADGPTPTLTMRTIPNPTTGATTIELRATGPIRGVTVSIYDVVGRLVRKLPLGDLAPGSHQVVWDRLDDGGRAVPSGIYHCVASIDGGGRTAKRLVVLK